jgi:hypothetical protein
MRGAWPKIGWRRLLALELSSFFCEAMIDRVTIKTTRVHRMYLIAFFAGK